MINYINNKKNKKKTSNNINKNRQNFFLEKKILTEGQRFKITFIFMLILFLFVIARIIHVQLILGNILKVENKQFRQAEEVIRAKRGFIYDTNGEQFACDIPIYSLWMDPNYFKREIEKKNINKNKAAVILENILNINSNVILKKINQNSGFVWIKKKLTFSEVSKIKELNYPGLVFQAENTRYYPKQDLAGNLIGFVNESGEGGAGIEATYNNILKGKDGLITGEKDGLNNFLQDTLKTKKTTVAGKSIQLTIDQRIQYVVDREIKNIISDLNPKRTSVVVLKTKTGEILGIGDKNIYNPNKYKDVNNLKFNNMVFQETYEPGSTIKPITASAIISEGLYSPDSFFYDYGSIKVDQYDIKCWVYPSNHGSETLTEAMANSCNPVFVKIILDLYNYNSNIWYTYIDKFGFGKPTSVLFAGEASGILPPNNASIYHATSAIGQGISVTPIQLVSAISVFGNNGIYVEPRLIKNILDEKGNIIKENKISNKGQIITKEVANKIEEMLKEVILKGTGKSGQLDRGIQSIGKTGTSEKANEEGKYYKDRYILSFIGMAPYPDIEYTVLVIIDEPNQYSESSALAGNYYKKIMDDILKIFAKDEFSNNYKEDSLFKNVVIPDLTGMTKIDAKKILENLELKATTSGEGFVKNQSIKPFEKVQTNTIVNIDLEEIELNKNDVVVISFIGMRLPEAIKKAEHLKLKIISKGKGVVKNQNIQVGNIVRKNSKIFLDLE